MLYALYSENLEDKLEVELNIIPYAYVLLGKLIADPEAFLCFLGSIGYYNPTLVEEKTLCPCLTEIE